MECEAVGHRVQKNRPEFFAFARRFRATELFDGARPLNGNGDQAGQSLQRRPRERLADHGDGAHGSHSDPQRNEASPRFRTHHRIAPVGNLTQAVRRYLGGRRQVGIIDPLSFAYVHGGSGDAKDADNARRDRVQQFQDIVGS